MSWDRIFADFDYVWGYQLPPDFAEVLRQRCTVVAVTRHAVLYRKR